MDDAIVDALSDHTAHCFDARSDSGRNGNTSRPFPSFLARLRNAEVVGLGEATHGTREFFHQKRRLLRHLVKRQGFRTIAIEADVRAMLAVDESVRSGRSDPASALTGLRKWMWKTEEMLSLLYWLRSFNDGRPHEDRVRVYGIDMSDPSAPAVPIQSYLQRVDPSYARSADELPTLVDFEIPSCESIRHERLEEAVGKAEAVRDRLDDRRIAYIDASSEPEWALARHLCRVIERTCKWNRLRYEVDGPHAVGMAERDRRMSENVAWCVERDPGNGVVVWAHNSHVQRGTFDDGHVWSDATTMGEHLDREFGDRYCPIGFDFGTGSFRAIGGGDGHGDAPQTFAVGEPIERSATAAFDALHTSPRFVDLASASDDERLESWLERPQRIRRIGTVYDPTADVVEYYQRTDLRASFDGIVSVAESTPSQPITSN